MANQNIGIKIIDFNMLRLLTRVIYNWCKNNVSPFKGKFNTKFNQLQG